MMRTLKTRLDRKTLQIIYFSFIRPLIEYADVVWDNCPRFLKDQLDKIQMEDTRIVTSCSKLVSLLDLTREAGWESLSERRRKHKLLLYFKMVNGLCPSTLSALVPQSIGNTSSYSLRGPQNHRIPTCRKELYKRSFLPTVIEEWNKLAIEIRNKNSISCFKNYLNRKKPTSVVRKGGYRAIPLKQSPHFINSQIRLTFARHPSFITPSYSLTLVPSSLPLPSFNLLTPLIS